KEGIRWLFREHYPSAEHGIEVPFAGYVVIGTQLQVDKRLVSKTIDTDTVGERTYHFGTHQRVVPVVYPVQVKAVGQFKKVNPCLSKIVCRIKGVNGVIYLVVPVGEIEQVFGIVSRAVYIVDVGLKNTEHIPVGGTGKKLFVGICLVERLPVACVEHGDAYAMALLFVYIGALIVEPQPLSIAYLANDTQLFQIGR